MLMSFGIAKGHMHLIHNPEVMRLSQTQVVEIPQAFVLCPCHYSAFWSQINEIL